MVGPACQCVLKNLDNMLKNKMLMFDTETRFFANVFIFLVLVTCNGVQHLATGERMGKILR